MSAQEILDAAAPAAAPAAPRPLAERLAANFYLAPPEMGAAAFADLAVAAGFRGIAWTVRALEENGPARLRQISAERGLFISTLNSAGYFLWGDAAKAVEQASLNRRLIAAAAEMGAGRLVVITGGLAHGRHTLETARARIAEGLAELANLAGPAGIRLALEPIHPADLSTKGCINAIAPALALARALPALDLAIDIHHSGWDADLWPLFPAEQGRVGVVQLCNSVEPHPDAKPVRELPDRGHWNVGGFLRHLGAAGYAGPVEFELFDHHRQGRPVGAMLAAARASLIALAGTG